MTHPTDDSLKPCPFCGGAAALHPRTCDKDTPYNPADRAFPIVRCGQCGAEAVGKNWGRPETAAEKWNTRALLAAQPAGAMQEARKTLLIAAANFGGLAPAMRDRCIRDANALHEAYTAQPRTDGAQWDASQIKQPGWHHVEGAFIEGAREAKENPDADDAMFRRAADGYTKRVFEEVDPESERRLRTGDFAAAQPAVQQPAENAPSDAMVDAYLTAQRAAVEEADRFGRPNAGGLHTNTVREACRAGLAAAIKAQGGKQ